MAKIDREERKAERQRKFEAAKAALLARVVAPKVPMIGTARPDQDNTPKLAPHLQRAAQLQSQSPKSTKDGSYFGAQVTWCITKSDQDGSWSWQEARAWSREEWEQDIHPPMTHLASLTWAEIDKQASGSGHKMHHGQEVSSLVGEAQDRWRELNLEQYDSAFRFRLGGKKRLWGFVVQGHFHTVWWDREHKIYPV